MLTASFSERVVNNSPWTVWSYKGELIICELFKNVISIPQIIQNLIEN